MDLAEYEQLNPRCEIDRDGTTVVYATPNRATQWRVDTLYTKEPVTIEWLGRLGADDVLADIGANVGMYTIWAAKLRGTRVYAFEPESQNYALLNRNIVLNGLSDRVKAYCVALSDRAGYAELHLSQFMPGVSSHSYGEKLDYKMEPMQPAFSQGCISATLDGMVEAGALPQPTHIKIDVDGIEHKILAGAKRTLQDKRLRSMLVEVNGNLEPHRAMVRSLEDAGWRYDRTQAAAAERGDGPFKGIGEYVFQR